MPLDLKNPHPMKIQIFGPFLQQLDAAIFHMEIQIILTNGLQIPKSICSYFKNQGTDVSQWKTTELSKLILAIEAIGYDPRDISSVDLLSAVGSRKSTELTYTTVYAINAIKAGGYTADTFKDTELNQWAHDTAKAFVKCRRQNFLQMPTIPWDGSHLFSGTKSLITMM